MTDPTTLYKLMILYMLKKVNFPMSNAQLWTFFDQKGYTNFITYQETIHALIEANLIREEEVRNTILYEIDEEGKQVLHYFGNEISETIKEDMDSYLKENRYQLRNETGITADYYRTSAYEYCVNCKVREGQSILFEMNLTVPTEDQAKTLSSHFEESAQEIYAFVMKRLM